VVWTADQIIEWERTGSRPAVAIWTAEQTARFLHSIAAHWLCASTSSRCAAAQREGCRIAVV
jgi:hypothetical protein